METKCKYAEINAVWEKSDKIGYNNSKGVWKCVDPKPLCTKKNDAKMQMRDQQFSYCDESKIAECIFFKPFKEKEKKEQQ